MNTLYTVGHSNHGTEYFLSLLYKYSITSVVDIRNVPYSKYVPQYNKDSIGKILASKGMHHVYMGEELGVIKSDKALLSPEGYLDFEKVRETEGFRIGIKRIKAGVSKGYIIAVMCTEKDPIDCHRSILIGRELYKEGYNVLHILPDGSLECTKEFEERLLGLYSPKKDQQDMFHMIEAPAAKEELLDRAYRLRNRDVGYRPDKKTEGTHAEKRQK